MGKTKFLQLSCMDIKRFCCSGDTVQVLIKLITLVMFL